VKTSNSPLPALKEQYLQRRVLLDYYKCPEDFPELEVIGEPSQREGFFHFGSGTTCYGRCHSGVPSNIPAGKLHESIEAVELKGGVVRLPFDLDEIVNNLRLERYANSVEDSSFLRFLREIRHNIYYFLRPWMPVSIRKHLQRLNLYGWRRLPFPQWPVDYTVDAILEQVLALCMKAKGISSVPFIWFWPNGSQCCLMMTHDVETSDGTAFCRELMSLDESFGVKSSFQLVPEGRYAVSETLREEMRSRGFEVNIQDLNHDGDLFRDREEFHRRAHRINDYMREFQAKGFRSAVMYRNADWLNAIAANYDMSFPSAAHLEPQRGGCCTTMPYFIGGIVELPLTTTQDYSLLHILGDWSVDLWVREIDSIRQKNGLVSFIVHPDYVKGIREQVLYRSLLEHLVQLRAEANVWMALPGEVDSWWRSRNEMKLTSHNGKWRIEGAGSERARIAYATFENGRITYFFDSKS
jgi:hypothetical protein